MEFGGLVVELLIFFGIPLIIPISIILTIGNLLHKEKLKKIILFALSLIYNSIVGFLSPLLFFCLILLLSELLTINCAFLASFLILAIILIPINIYMIIKSKINPILYILFNIIIFVVSYIAYVTLISGSGNVNL